MKYLLLLAIIMAQHAFASRPKIAVIGGGLAGLTTAWRLQQENLDVHVYEARARAGGRIFSIYLNGVPSELGGQNIADGGEGIYTKALIEEMGLTLIEKHLPPITHNYFDGEQLIPQKNLLCAIPHLRAHLIDAARVGNNMRDVLNALVKPDTPLYHVLDTRLAAYEGAPLEKLSTLYINTLYSILMGGLLSSSPTGVVNYTVIEGGNSLLTQALADRLHITFNMPVTSIERSQTHQYQLNFADGTIEYADIIVLAVPCSLYKSILCADNVIPAERKHFLDSLENGSTTKILVPQGTSTPHLDTVIDNNSIAWVRDNVLTIYYTQEASFFSATTVDATYQSKKDMIEKALGPLSSQTAVYAEDRAFSNYTGPVGYSWPHDLYAKGSYSSVAPGQEIQEHALLQEEGEIVRAPFASIDGTLYFVGEHTSLAIRGTIEGACESGTRTAIIIKKRLKS